jgi:hypothetical protein
MEFLGQHKALHGRWAIQKEAFTAKQEMVHLVFPCKREQDAYVGCFNEKLNELVQVFLYLGVIQEFLYLHVHLYIVETAVSRTIQIFVWWMQDHQQF